MKHIYSFLCLFPALEIPSAMSNDSTKPTGSWGGRANFKKSKFHTFSSDSAHGRNLGSDKFWIAGHYE